MFLLSGLDTSISHNEKRSFYRFMGMYIVLVIVVMTVLATLYYNFQKSLMLSEYQLQFTIQSDDYLQAIEKNPQQFYATGHPAFNELHSGVYDGQRRRIFSDLRTPRVDLNKNISLNGKYIQYVMYIDSNIENAKYLVLEEKDDGFWLSEYRHNLFVYGVPLFLVLVVLGYLLAKEFLEPMKRSVALLDNFIQDATHELNTPVTTVLTNLEVLSKKECDASSKKNIERTMTAVRTISDIYNSLVMVSLTKTLKPQDKHLLVSEHLQERIDYFKTRIDVKNITITMVLDQECHLDMDIVLLRSMLDNLLSNAIKYNDLNGFIEIQLEGKKLTISNSGESVNSQYSKTLFDRYVRSTNSEGGFGLGLNIVANIAQYYSYSVQVSPLVPHGTKVEVDF